MTEAFAPSAEQLKTLARWRVSTFWVMLVGYIGYYLVRGNLPVALPLLSQEFGYTNTQLGAILTFAELAYALGKFTNGPLADRVGGRRIFLIGMWGSLIFSFAFPLHPGIPFFVAVACLSRYFLSMGWGGIIKTIGEWYEPERNGTIMGLISVNFQFGGVLASLFGSLLIYLGSGWKGLFIWPAVAVFGLAIASHLASKESPQAVVPGVRFGKNAGAKRAAVDFRLDAPADGLAIVKRLLAVPLFRQVLVFSFVVHILRSFFMVWVPKFMVDLGMGNVNAALTSAVFPLMGCVGTIALGWYTDRYAVGGDRAAAMWKMLLGLVFSLAAIALLIPRGMAAGGMIVVLLGASGLFLYGPYSMSSGCLTLDIAGPEGAGTCTGLIDGIGYVGGALASWGAGYLADIFGWSEVFWTLSAISLFTVAWTWYMSWYAQRAAVLRPAASFAAAAVAVTLFAGCSTGPIRARRFEVQGHRGARAVRPENTLSAFRYALEAGVDTLELDLHVTKDDVLVVAHDPFVNPKLCLGPGGSFLEDPPLIRKLSLADLKSYDCGSLKNPRFPAQVPQPGERIPSFAEVLQWLALETDSRARYVRLNVETKLEEAHPDEAPDPETFARLVVDELRRHRVVERTTLQSFDFRTLVAARKLEPRLRISALVDDRPAEPLAAIATRLKADIVSPNHEWLTAGDVAALHEAGVRVVPWTANDEASWKRLAEINVDGIITDDPVPLLEFRRRMEQEP